MKWTKKEKNIHFKNIFVILKNDFVRKTLKHNKPIFFDFN